MNSNEPCDVNKAHCLKTQLVIREVCPLSTFVKKTVYRVACLVQTFLSLENVFSLIHF